MKERPVLFSAPMIRALLDGSKTQTRRAVHEGERHDHIFGTAEEDTSGREFFFCGGPEEAIQPPANPMARALVGARARPITGAISCPYGQPGDRLWVREAWAWYGCERDPHEVVYRADTAVLPPLYERWRPSIHMFRWASRITLEITGVSVERLQDITADDAVSEGIESDRKPEDRVCLWRNYSTGGTTVMQTYSYQTLWESINGAGSWEANPWVWRIEFRRAT